MTSIITLPHPCLTTQAKAIQETPNGLQRAKEIIKDLELALHPHLPAAGLAAPQIGISERVMIFSWDRSPQHMEAAINPSYRPLDQERQLGWEGCFSVPLALVQVSRYQNIICQYTRPNGQLVQYILRGFAARVFQHETDHLDGIETIHNEGAKIQNFRSQADLISFLNDVKVADQTHYIEPEQVE